jgi:hypothetical protein
MPSDPTVSEYFFLTHKEYRPETSVVSIQGMNNLAIIYCSCQMYLAAPHQTLTEILPHHRWKLLLRKLPEELVLPIAEGEQLRGGHSRP